MAKYICIEGMDGTGKTTLVNLLKETLESMGNKILVVEEPGTSHNELTMNLRRFALDKANEKSIEGWARETIFLATRAITLTNVVFANFKNYDYIIQSRGILTGLSYGAAFGLDLETMKMINSAIISSTGKDFGKNGIHNIYDKLIMLKNTKPMESLERAKKKAEFNGEGDAIEQKGLDYHTAVLNNFKEFSKFFDNYEELFVTDEEGNFKDKNELVQKLISLSE